MFVINPHSFKKLSELKEFLLSVENCFSTGKRAEYKVYVSRYPRDAIAAVHRYITGVSKSETVRVYAVGGDGILFDCLNGLVGFPNAELANVPYGSANDFLRSFGENSVGRFRDIRTLSRSPSIPTDIAQCGSLYSIANAAVGLEASAVSNVYKMSQVIGNVYSMRKFVPLIYLFGGIISILKKEHRLQHYNLMIDGVDYSGEYVNISIGNVFSNGGSNSPNPYAVPNDGVLNVVIIKAMSALKALIRVPAYTSGHFEKYPNDFQYITCKKIACTSDKVLRVVLDGELYMTNEFEMEVIPNGVNIVAPESMTYKMKSEAEVDDRNTGKAATDETANKTQ
jgi:diacylglycerol kinase family enzyme